MSEDLVALRTEVRLAEFGRDFWPNWNTGGCYMVTESLHVERGWGMDGGCYVDGEVHADDHFWNVVGDTMAHMAPAVQACMAHARKERIGNDRST